MITYRQRRTAEQIRQQGERSRRRMYNAILEYCAEHGGNFPTYRDLCDLCDIASTSTVGYHMEALVNEGLVEWKDGRLMVVGSKWIAPKGQVR